MDRIKDIFDNYKNDILQRANMELKNEYPRWCKELPFFNFDKEWNVKISMCQYILMLMII